MAGIRALTATCEAVARILESTAIIDNIGFDMQFKVYGPADFTSNLVTTGVTVFPYRVLPNLSHRIPAGRTVPDGGRFRTRLPLDLHLLLTIWATRPDTESTIVAWMMRTLEDYPTLPASLLNVNHEETFAPDESVDLVVGEIPGEEVLHLWEVLGERVYHLSIPYVARAIYVDSKQVAPTPVPVQIRRLNMGVYDGVS